jgi:quercetin dioxygenase-like cupin family protein
MSGLGFARRLTLVGALLTALALTTAGTALGGLVGGSLPTAGFTFTSVTDNEVNIAGDGIHLKTKGSVNVKTTYTRFAPSATTFFGWHYHQGPVILTVTAGPLTYLDAACHTWDVTAGHSYIESPGEVLNAMADPAKNVGVATVEWFTTRLYPADGADPVPVDAPCTP